MDTPATRLKSARQKAGYEAAKTAAEAMGIPVATYIQHENGVRGIPAAKADRYARFFRVQPEWLLYGKSAPLASIKGDAVRWVPLVGRAPAGNWREAIEVPIGEVAVRADKAGRNAFAVEIDGDSMDLILPEGGWAVIDPDLRHFFEGRVYLVMNGEHEVTLKRYCGNPSRLVPVSRNDSHGPIFLTGEPITIIGRVVAYGNDQGL